MSASPANVWWGGGGFSGLLEAYPNAAGAYSLRRLSKGGDKVVRLRRASDNAEKDFYAGELTVSVTGNERAVNGDFETGDLTGWGSGAEWSVNGSNQLECDGTQASRTTCTQTAICPPVGDTNYYRLTFDIISCSNFTNAGIRLASSSYGVCEFIDMGVTSAGSYSLLINTSLCTTQKFDIFCNAGVTLVMDNISMVEYEPSVAEFWAYGGPYSGFGFPPADSSDAYATTWYDQSGSGNDATQTTAARQPLLILAGVTNTENGKPALSFDGVDDNLSVGSTALSTAIHDMFMVNASSDNSFIVTSQGTGGVNYGWTGQDGSGANGSRTEYGTPSLYKNGSIALSSTRDQIHSAFGSGVQALTSTIGANTAAWSDFMLFGYAEVDFRFVTNAQEVIIYPSDQDANRIGIEGNIADGWCMPYPTMPIVSECMPTPAAAYSLRSLDGSTSTNVVRLRRASDNEESDFTAADLAGGVEGAELVTNGGFDTDSDWTKDTGWSITGGQAVCDGTQVSTASLDQNGIWNPIADGDLYILEITIVACSDFSACGLYGGVGSLRNFSAAYGITAPGTYRIIRQKQGDGNPFERFEIYASAGQTLTIDNVSLKPYTPTAAEQWSFANMTNGIGKQTTDSALVTTLYDQANEDSGKELVGTGGSLVESDWILNGPNAVFSNGQIILYRDAERLDPAEPSGTATYVGSPIKAGRKYYVDIGASYGATPIGGYEIVLADDDHAWWSLNPATLEPTVDGGVSFEAVNLKDSIFTISSLSVRDITNDSTQPTSTAQPKLITAGVTELENGKPAMVFDGVNDYFDISTNPITVLDNLMVSIVAKPNQSSNEYGVTLSESTERVYVPRMASGNLYIGYDDSQSKLSDGAFSASQQLVTLSVDSTTASGFQNGAAFSVTPTATAETAAVVETSLVPQIGALGGSATWNGTFQEVIIYPSDQSANRTIIETNINAHYCIWYDENWSDWFTWCDNKVWND